MGEVFVGGFISSSYRHTLQVRVLEITLSYFLYDTLYCALIERNLEMTLHHIATLSGLGTGTLMMKVGQ